ncbi:MAG: Crp/Fnr family transcriptional regulator [Pseudomonadota bacterium]
MALYDPFDRFVEAVLPSDISKGMLAEFRSLSRSVNIQRGQTAIKANGVDQIAFVASGSTKLVAHASGGREQIVDFQFTGDLVAVPAQTAHAYTIDALETGELLQFNARSFYELACAQPRLLVAIVERASLSLSHYREKAITLGRTSAQEKMAGFFLAIADRIGVPDKTDDVVTLPMSRRDIADSLGLSTETVSRQVTALRAAGLLSTDGRSIFRLSDRAALNARAGNLPIIA